MKAVPSTSQVQVDGLYKLKRDSVNLEWNIADQAALEAALQLDIPNRRITVLTMGPAKLESSMSELLARGADKAVLLTDPAFAGADTYATAKTLSAAINKLGKYDLILCGRRAIDGETGQVPGLLSGALEMSCVTNINKLLWTGQELQAYRSLEKGSQQLTLPHPVLLSVCEYAYTLRLPGIMAMRRAKSKSITTYGISDLGIDPSQCGIKGSLTKVITMSSTFPGLRKGPKEYDISAGIDAILSIIKEAK